MLMKELQSSRTAHYWDRIINNHVLNEYKSEALEVLLPNNYLIDYKFRKL